MENQNKLQIIEKLWQKHCYKDNQDYKTDRTKVLEEYQEITGEEITLGVLKSHILKLDRENLYIEKYGGVTKDFTKQTQNDDGSIVSQIRRRMLSREVFTNEELLELHSISPTENKIKQIISNEWTITNKDGDAFYNFQSKIIAIPIGEQGITIEEFRELLREPTEKVTFKPIGIGVRNLVIGLADLHFPLTTFEELERDIAETCEIIENGYDTIIIEQLGDLFESSQMQESITVNGTILPTVDMVKGLKDAKKLYHKLIEHSLLYANKVQIEHACGNHSGNFEYFFLDAIADRYKVLKEPRVIVNNHNDYRTAFTIGNVAIMLSHGDTIALKNLPLKFASEYPLLWGNAEHRECHTGHKHNQFTSTDIDGAVMRQFPTPKPNSKYEDKWGYLSRKFIQLVEYSDDSSKTIYEIG